jgi:hypothetical protein
MSVAFVRERAPRPPSLSPEALAEDKADHVFLIVGSMSCAHAETVNRARGLGRSLKREVRA